MRSAVLFFELERFVMRKMFVSDTTLRVQCEELKNTLSFRERLNIASRLEKIGVDAIELPALTGSKEDSTLEFYRRAGYNSTDKTAFVQWL
jgi:isopropylmalate/homocitrate/citramalate synthase